MQLSLNLKNQPAYTFIYTRKKDENKGLSHFPFFYYMCRII